MPTGESQLGPAPHVTLSHLQPRATPNAAALQILGVRREVHTQMTYACHGPPPFADDPLAFFFLPLAQARRRAGRSGPSRCRGRRSAGRVDGLRPPQAPDAGEGAVVQGRIDPQPPNFSFEHPKKHRRKPSCARAGRAHDAGLAGHVERRCASRRRAPGCQRRKADGDAASRGASRPLAAFVAFAPRAPRRRRRRRRRRPAPRPAARRRRRGPARARIQRSCWLSSSVRRRILPSSPTSACRFPSVRQQQRCAAVCVAAGSQQRAAVQAAVLPQFLAVVVARVDRRPSCTRIVTGRSSAPRTTRADVVRLLVSGRTLAIRFAHEAPARGF